MTRRSTRITRMMAVLVAAPLALGLAAGPTHAATAGKKPTKKSGASLNGASLN